MFSFNLNREMEISFSRADITNGFDGAQGTIFKLIDKARGIYTVVCTF